MCIMNMEQTNLYFNFGWTHFSYVPLLSHAEPFNSYPNINVMHMSFKETRFIITCIPTNTIQTLKRDISIQWNETVQKNLKNHTNGHNHNLCHCHILDEECKIFLKGMLVCKCGIVPTHTYQLLFVYTFPLSIK
jgi:hypothetical protein